MGRVEENKKYIYVIELDIYHKVNFEFTSKPLKK